MSMTAKEMCDLVAQKLKEHDWRFRLRDFGDGEFAVDSDVSSKSGVFRFYELRFLFQRAEMRTIYYLPVKAPEAMRQGAADYITRINWRTRYGKFMMDFDDGELRYECIFGEPAIKADVDDVLGDSIDMMRSTLDRYAAGLVAVLGGGKSAEAAFQEAIKPKEAPAPAPEEGDAEPAPEPPPAEQGGDPSPTPSAEVSPEPPAPVPKKKGGKKGAKAASNYSLKGLNITTPVPLKDIVAAVKKFREGTGCPDVDAPRLNILLSGAAGSGKTAFVKHLAKMVGARLNVLKASDLIGRYTGETEKAIAAAFADAKENNEILFLDEIDSFLQDRAGALRSWEVSQVNELLQQMEEFEGVMIGATNFAENLDKAVLRRFTYKIKLDYLTDEGKGIFFRRYFKTRLTAAEKIRLQAIDKLTPGDFRTVREELYYLAGKQTNAARLEALEAESALKGRESAKIGF